jgi:hypothetical protein
MLQIIIDGKQAVLPVDIEISLNYFNPCFGERKEDATYPLTLNLKANRHIFGYPERTNNIEKDYKATVIFKSHKAFSGVLSITSISNNSIEIFIATDNSTFWGKYGEKLISDLDLGEELIESSLIETLSKSLCNRKPYVITPILDTSFNEYAYVVGYHNRWDFITQQIVDEQTNHLCPFPRLFDVIEMVIKALGYNLSRNDLDYYNEYEDLIIVNRRTIEYRSNKIRYNKIVPVINVKDFFKEIHNKFNINLYVNESSRTVELIANNTNGFNHISLDVEDHISMKKEDSEEDIFNYLYKDIELEDEEYQIKNNSFLEDNKGDETKDINCKSVATVAILSTVQRIPITYEEHGNTMNEEVLVDYPLLYTSSKFNKSEFRISVYRGIHDYQTGGSDRRNKNSKEGKFSTVPVSSSFPISESSNKISLAWRDLYQRFHQDKMTLRKKSLIIEYKVLNISLLKASKIFKSILIIRGKKHIAINQTISIGCKQIKEFSIECHAI